MENKLDWKEAAWDLERIFRKQFAPATSETSFTLNQTNNTLNLTDGAALQEARRALDEVQAEKAARRQSIEAETTGADLLVEPAPEPSPQSPTPTEPAERWRDKYPHQVVPLSLRKTVLDQARRMGRSDGEGKGIF